MLLTCYNWIQEVNLLKSINFRRTSSAERAAQKLAQIIQERLDKKQRVLWLVSGGSAGDVAVGASKLLADHPNLNYLYISLVDERYGPPRHDDSNWEHLAKKGFNFSGTHIYPVLNGKALEKTVSDFNSYILKIFDTADFKIALLGIGTDGHTAGILPHSPVISSRQYVSSYKASDFTRITLTPKALVIFDEVFVFAIGEQKHQALLNLKKNLPISDQPGQVIKLIPSVYVYNDLMGEEK